MDESGVQLGDTGREKVVHEDTANNEQPITGEPVRHQWTSSIEAISASGRKIDPLLIFPGAAVYTNWIPEHLDKRGCSDWKFTHSTNGWTSYDIGYYWLSECFEPQTQPSGRRTWRLLIMDNHGSHCSIRFMRTCLEKQIILLYLSPHSSHITQPLNVGIFGPLKRYFRSKISLLAGEYDLARIQKHQYVDLYIDSRIHAMTEYNITKGFEKSGIWPRNPLKLLSSSFIKDKNPLQSTPKQHTIKNLPKNSQELAGLSEREARFQARDIASALREKDAEIVILRAQLNAANTQLDATSSQKKRKKVVQEDSNKKLVTVRSILGSQELARREQEEEENRAKRKKTRLENAAKKAKKTLSNLEDDLD
jgi:hypothetical protein